MRSEEEVQEVIERYADTIRRICMIHVKKRSDVEDIFQTVFLKYALSSCVFESEEHRKAWLIRVSIHACKDLLKSFFRTKIVSLEEIMEPQAAIPIDHQEVLEAVLSLPLKYRDVIYLHYYEGYSAPQISTILHKNVNTIYTWINRSKQLLKEMLGDEGNNERSI